VGKRAASDDDAAFCMSEIWWEGHAPAAASDREPCGADARLASGFTTVAVSAAERYDGKAVTFLLQMPK
jgi:hypothetical protein